MSTFRVRPIHQHVRAALGVVAGCGLAGLAYADDALSTPPAEDVEEVVVTGFRASLNAALEDKRASTAAIDSIRAEDIAKNADSNLAEAIQRIPGAAITRDAGEGRNLSVRGLGAQYTRVRINGMEAQSTTGGTDSSGGANRNRQFDFNVFAAELFNSITARKTSTADVDEGSLGATVDLQTARPFDYRRNGGFAMAAAVKGAYNDLSDEIDPRATFLVSNTFGASEQFGALFSAAYTRRTLLEEGSSTVRWDAGSSVGGFNPASTPTGITLEQANAAFHPRIPRYGQLQHEQERLGLTGALQWQIDDANLVGFDVLYSDFSAERNENYLEAFSFSRNASQGGKPATLIRAGEIDADGTLVYGLFDNVDLRSEARHDELETIFSQYTLSASHQLGRWKLSELAGYSRSEFDNPVQTTITLDRSNSANYSWDYRGNSRLPAFSYGFDPATAGSWAFGAFEGGSSEIRIRPQGVDNTFKVGKIDLEFEASDAVRLQFGLDYKNFEFATFESRRASETSVTALPASALTAMTRLVGGFGSGLDIPAGTPTAWLIPDIDAFASAFDIYGNSGMFALGSITNANARGNNRGVEEEDRGAWLQAVFSLDGGIPLRGDVGLRYARTTQTSWGYLPAAGAPLRLTEENEYSEWLPSLNLVAELSPNLLMRASAAKVMTRPALGQVTPGGSINLVGNLTVATGNPFLEPTRASTCDLSVEWYFDDGALLSGAVFYKDIDTFVQTLVEGKPFNESGLPLDLLAGTTLTGNEEFAFSTPVNTDGGPLHGFEINYQQPFRFLPGNWSNLGLLLNYTYVDSEIDYVTSATGATPPVSNDLVNLSKRAWNATIYYESGGLSVRTSAAYRDRYLTTVPASNAPTRQDAEGTNGTLNLDLSASYAINENLSISLEGLNLTDEVNDQFIDTVSDRVVVYTHTGRQLYLGASYRF